MRYLRGPLEAIYSDQNTASNLRGPLEAIYSDQNAASKTEGEVLKNK
jgi:hypothetical protein